MAEENHNTVEVTKENFEKEVLEFPGVVLIDFWAVWCGPCKTMSPRVHELADKYKDNDKVKIVEVNVDSDGGLSGEHSVLSIPTFKAFAKGEAFGQQIGVIPSTALEAMIEDGLKKLS